MPRLQECRAISALNQALSVFPKLRRDTLADKTPATRHTSGLAIDIFFNSTDPLQKKHALELIDVLVKHHKAMQWSDLIYTNFHIGGGIGGYMGDGRTKFPWKDGGHNDHIHLDWVDRRRPTGPEGSAAFINNPWDHSPVSNQTSWRELLEEDFKLLASNWGLRQQVAPVPEWLVGWWKVLWRSQYYYYYFDRGRLATWTELAPLSTQTPPICFPTNTGKVTVNSKGDVSITWNDTGSVEKFAQSIGSNSLQMDGWWQDVEPLSAKKL